MLPAVQFGGVVGPTRSVVGGGKFKIKVNLSTGRAYSEPLEPLFEPIQVSTDSFHTHFEMNGNNIRAKTRCNNLEHLNGFVSTLFYAFPAVLNLYMQDVPVAGNVRGRVGSVPFQWLYQPTQLIVNTIVTSKAHQEQIVSECWQRIGLFSSIPHRRLIGALYYFFVGCRLLAAGANQFEFLSEALLNFSRCLQSLFGETRDSVRDGLRKLNKYSDDEIEGKFVTALVLRSEFDIAHVSLADLTADELKTVHGYGQVAEREIRKMLATLLERVEKKEYIPVDEPDEGILTPKKKKILSNIRENLSKLSIEF